LLNLSDSAKSILAAQVRWSRGRPLDSERSHYVAKSQDNLFLRRLKPETEAEFLAADGAELSDTGKRPAKMRALVSSSALAVNFFDAWRDEDKRQLSVALGLPREIEALRFEWRPDNYPVRPRSPNLDLLLTLAGGGRVAVESKFTEPYTGAAPGLSKKYFPGTPGLWAAAGLGAVQTLADTLRPAWQYLDVPQLLKHMLGLASDPNSPTILLYLWYDTGLADARIHGEEVARFSEQVGGDRIRLVPKTYQEVFESLSPGFEPAEGWRAYVGDRYLRRVVPRETGIQ
jgi:hypothetical protein